MNITKKIPNKLDIQITLDGNTRKWGYTEGVLVISAHLYPQSPLNIDKPLETICISNLSPIIEEFIQ